MEINMESIILKNNSVNFQDLVKGECKTEIDSSSVSKILGIYVKAINSDSELVENEIRYKSQVIYSICYVDNEKKITKYECGGEISGEIKGVTSDNGYVKLRIDTEKVEGDVSNLHLTIKGIFNVKATVYYQEKNSYVCGGDNLILKKGEVNYFKSYGKRKTVYPIEEEFELSYSIKNILTHKITPTITSCQCGVGCIIVDGDVNISALLLQNGENDDIIREEKKIPFRAEVEYEETMPQMLAVADVMEKSFKTDITVDEENNKSVVRASISLNIEGEAFAECSSVVCEDVFCLQKELTTEVNICEKVKPLEQVSVTEKIKRTDVMVDGITNQRLLAVGFEKVEIVDAKFVVDSILVSGVIGFIAIFRGDDGEIVYRKVESDFNSSILLTENPKASYNVYACVVGLDAKMLQEGSLSFEASVNFTVFGEEREKVRLLQNVLDVGDKKKDNSSISVYIALENEELWSLAKRLNTPPEEICETNKELQFPLTGSERIVIYRQKG